MNLEVKSISIRSATATTLVAELEVELRQDYPPHYIHELDVTSFEAVDGIFLVCLVEDNPIGCLALRPLDPDTAELKRMFVRRRSRGLGAARLMLREMESRAMAKGFKQITKQRQSTGIRPAASDLIRIPGSFTSRCTLLRDPAGSHTCISGRYEKIISMPCR